MNPYRIAAGRPRPFAPSPPSPFVPTRILPEPAVAYDQRLCRVLLRDGRTLTLVAFWALWPEGLVAV